MERALCVIVGRVDAGDLVKFDSASRRSASPRRSGWRARRACERLICAGVPCRVVWSLHRTTGATVMRAALVRSAGGHGDADSGEDWLCRGVSLAFRGGSGWSKRR